MSDSEAENDFRFLAMRWARARGELLAPGTELDAEMNRYLDSFDEKNPLDLDDSFFSALNREFLTSSSESLTRELLRVGSAQGVALWRSVEACPSETEIIELALVRGFSEDEVRDFLESGREEGRALRLAGEKTVVEIHRLLYGNLAPTILAKHLVKPFKLFPLLLSLSGVQRELLASQYEERYHQPLSEVFQQRTRSEVASALCGLLSGNVALGVLGFLRASAPLSSESILEVERAVWQLPRHERRRFEHEFRELKNRVQPLTTDVPHELRMALVHLVNGSLAECDANLIAFDIREKRFESALERLHMRSPLARKRLVDAYRACFTRELAEDLDARLPEPYRVYAHTLFAGDEQAAVAWRGRLVLEEKLAGWIGEALRGPERNRFLGAFVELFGANTLPELLEKRYRGRDLEIARELLSRGFVPWAKLLWFAVVGLGTDEAALVALLEDTDNETQNRLESEFLEVWKAQAPWYEKPFPKLFGNLRRRLWLECAGDCWFELRQSLDSHSTPIERVRARYEHETSSRLIRMLRHVSKELSALETDMRNLQELARDPIQGNALAEFRFQTLTELSKLDCEVSRMTKHLVGNHITTFVASCGVFLAAFMLTFLELDLPVVMLTVGLISGVLRFILKKVLKGPGYHRDEMFADIGFAVVDGSTLYLGRLFRQALIRASARFTSKLGLKQSIAIAIRRLREVSSEVESHAIRELAERESPRKNALSIEHAKPNERGFFEISRRMRDLSSEAKRTH